MMHVITRKLEFDAGHRVYKHESKCAHIHGHRYVVEISVTAPELDSLGRVIEFGYIKSICGKWIDEHLDHGMILFKDDPLVKYWNRGFVVDPPEWEDKKVEQHRHFIMDKNPTAENIAEMLYYKCGELLGHCQIRVFSIKVWETPNCWAVFKG